MKPELKEYVQTILNTFYQGNAASFVNDIQNEQWLQDLQKLQWSTQKLEELRRRGELLISLKNINKQYKMGSSLIQAVKNINLEIFKGEFVAIVGPSGSGKSTLLHLIGGLDKPSSGEIIVSGHKLDSLKETERANYRNSTIGFVFQAFYLQPYFTVLENIEIPLVLRGENPTIRRLKAIEAAAKVSLSDRAEHLPKQLSGGQMQRVAIARALVNSPAIILADEPTANLDKLSATEVVGLLRDINSTGTTVIVVTHNESIAAAADRVINIANGEILP